MHSTRVSSKTTEDSSARHSLAGRLDLSSCYQISFGFIIGLDLCYCWTFYLVGYKLNFQLCKVLLFICTLFTLQIVYNELRKICGFPPSFLFPLFSCSFSSSSQLPLPLRPSFLSPLFIPFSPFLSSNLHVPQHTMTLLSRSYHLETFIYQEI